MGVNHSLSLPQSGMEFHYQTGKWGIWQTNKRLWPCEPERVDQDSPHKAYPAQRRFTGVPFSPAEMRERRRRAPEAFKQARCTRAQRWRLVFRGLGHSRVTLTSGSDTWGWFPWRCSSPSSIGWIWASRLEFVNPKHGLSAWVWNPMQWFWKGTPSYPLTPVAQGLLTAPTGCSLPAARV